MSIFDKDEHLQAADGATDRFPLTQAVIDQYQERAAIMEYDAELSRQEAEAAAFKDYARYAMMALSVIERM
jgi:hypothetical protein